MSESLKIIQICDHVIKTPYEEKKTVELLRQEQRDDDYWNHSDNRLMYRGDWVEEIVPTGGSYPGLSLTGRTIVGTPEGQKVPCMKSSSYTSILNAVFYGDNITLKGITAPDGGKVTVYIDDVFISVTDMYSEISRDNFSIIEVVNLDYNMHQLRVVIEQTSNPASSGSAIRITGAIIKDAFHRELLPFDYICHGEVVTRIDYVSQFINGKMTVFKEGTDFLLFTTNKIKWLGLHRPHPNYPYTVEYFVQKFDIKNYSENGCPRCYGLGWYGSLQNVVDKQSKKVTGIHKIAEDIIKIILTPIQEDGYGSNFPEMNKNLYMSPQAVEDQARSEMHRIEVYYKTVQAEDMSKGAEYDPADVLYALSVDSASFVVGDASLNLVLTVYNNEGQGKDVEVKI